jgi:hypothetical protein
MVTNYKANTIWMQINGKSVLVKPFSIRKHILNFIGILQFVSIIVMGLAVLA